MSVAEITTKNDPSADDVLLEAYGSTPTPEGVMPELYDPAVTTTSPVLARKFNGVTRVFGGANQTPDSEITKRQLDALANGQANLGNIQTNAKIAQILADIRAGKENLGQTSSTQQYGIKALGTKDFPPNTELSSVQIGPEFINAASTSPRKQALDIAGLDWSDPKKTRAIQELVLTNGGKLPKHGADGDAGRETFTAVAKFFQDRNLPQPRSIEDVGATLYAGAIKNQNRQASNSSFSPNDIDIMTRTILGEAGGESLKGKVAVAHAIKNRMKQGFGSSITAVCLSNKQFSCWNKNDPNYARITAISPNSRQYIEARKIAMIVMRGDVPDPTNGATHYLTVARYNEHQRNRKDGVNWSSGVTPAKIEGQHAFFFNRQTQKGYNNAIEGPKYVARASRGYEGPIKLRAEDGTGFAALPPQNLWEGGADLAMVRPANLPVGGELTVASNTPVISSGAPTTLKR